MSYKIITVNRTFESAGSEIAQEVASRLNLPYYDKFLITASAEEVGLDEARVAAKDEQLESRFEYSQAEAAYYYTSSDHPLPTGARVAEIQFDLIRKLAEEGPCVIVGRCANYILRDRDDVLDVFIYAGLETRVQRTMEKLGLGEKEARKLVKRTDKARKAYYRNYTKSNWNDLTLYDMVLNTDQLSVWRCIDAICDAYNK